MNLRATLPRVLLAAVVLAACEPPPEVEPDTATEAPATDAAVEPAPAVASTAETVLLDPNAATREQLLGVPHVEDALADALVAGRPYATMLEVDRLLAGRLDEAQREEVYSPALVPAGPEHGYRGGDSADSGHGPADGARV